VLSDIDTREGLEMLHRRHIDLVLLDLHMLRVHGLGGLRPSLRGGRRSLGSAARCDTHGTWRFDVV